MKSMQSQKEVEHSVDYFEICSAFKKEDYGFKGKDEEHIKHQWQSFEYYEIGKRLENILENVNGSDKKEEWYYKIQIIQGRFKEKFQRWCDGKQEYISRKICIICGKKPNCLEKNWLTRDEFEKIKFSVMVNLKRGKKEPSNSK